MTSLDNLLKEGRIDSVEPDVAVARDKIEEAKRPLASAAAIAEDDPEGAYSLVSDAARKAADAHMLANGYRASKSKVGAPMKRRRAMSRPSSEGSTPPMPALSTECESSGTAPSTGSGTSHLRLSKQTAPMRRESSKPSRPLRKARATEWKSASSGTPTKRGRRLHRSRRHASRRGRG